MELNSIEVTTFWARVVGLWMIIATGSQLVRRKRFAEMERNLYENPGAVANSALIHLLIGLLIVAGHNVWELSWRVIITLGGWLFVLKGANRLVFPEMDTRIALSLDREGTRSRWITPVLIGFLAFNVWVAYLGFTR